MSTIKNEFEEIVKLCESKVDEYGDYGSYFKEPATEDEILAWEKENGIKIPEDYKEWLRLTKTCQMCQTIATFIFPRDKQPEFLPSEYILIGFVVGDGEVVCFSKSTGKYVTYFEGKVYQEYENFEKLLVEIKKDIRGDLPEIAFTEERLKAMMEKLEKRRMQKGNK